MGIEQPLERRFSIAQLRTESVTSHPVFAHYKSGDHLLEIVYVEA